jgi:hypothetical protein
MHLRCAPRRPGGDPPDDRLQSSRSGLGVRRSASRASGKPETPGPRNPGGAGLPGGGTRSRGYVGGCNRHEAGQGRRISGNGENRSQRSRGRPIGRWQVWGRHAGRAGCGARSDNSPRCRRVVRRKCAESSGLAHTKQPGPSDKPQRKASAFSRGPSLSSGSFLENLFQQIDQINDAAVYELGSIDRWRPLQILVTLVAWGPFWPWPVSKLTR